MKQVIVKQIDIKQFNALVAHSRYPGAGFNSKELAWFSNEEKTLLGVLGLDTTDDDYVGTVLGRDEIGRFCLIDFKISMLTEQESKDWINNTIKWHSRDNKKVFPQVDCKKKALDLFTVVQPLENLSPVFLHLTRENCFSPAKQIISEIMPHYVDIDKSFVKEFQSINGFDARLWELYLNSYITEEALFVIREDINRKKINRPDFLVKKYGQSVAIEAVTVGRRKDKLVSIFDKPTELPSPKEREDRLLNEIPIRFQRALCGKLKKKYWTLEHVKDIPLVFAIADFHDDKSMLWTSTGLIEYLYGVRHTYRVDKNGDQITELIPIESHEKFNGEKVPSGFFFLPDAENISAVLFSTHGTISKFNRMGRQAGYIPLDTLIVRSGTCYDSSINKARQFRYLVDETCNETWGEGLSMFHNPNAKKTVPKGLFPTIAHHYFKNGEILSILPDFFPYESQTLHLCPSKQ